MSSPDKEDCVICGPWPESNRELMRRFCCIAIPLTETVCDECIAAFFIHMGEEKDCSRHRRPLKPRRH